MITQKPLHRLDGDVVQPGRIQNVPCSGRATEWRAHALGLSESGSHFCLGPQAQQERWGKNDEIHWIKKHATILLPFGESGRVSMLQSSCRIFGDAELYAAATP
jgi:hypothetical protein